MTIVNTVYVVVGGVPLSQRKHGLPEAAKERVRGALQAAARGHHPGPQHLARQYRRVRTMDYNKAFDQNLDGGARKGLGTKLHVFFGNPVLLKVCHSKGNEKRNLMALVSVAWHLRVGSYERQNFLSTVHLNGETNLETKAFSTPKLKEL